MYNNLKRTYMKGTEQFKEIIKNYLDNRAKEDELFRAKYDCHRSKAVCCTGSCGNNGIFSFQCCVVYIVNNSRKIVSSRSRNNNFASACFDVSLCFCLGGIETSTLQNNVYTKLAPRKLRCISLCVDFDFCSINCMSTLGISP